MLSTTLYDLHSISIYGTHFLCHSIVEVVLGSAQSYTQTDLRNCSLEKSSRKVKQNLVPNLKTSGDCICPSVALKFAVKRRIVPDLASS
jgi:hypothetical protein